MCYSFFRCRMKRGGESVKSLVGSLVLKSNMGRLPLAELMFNPNMLVGNFYRTPGSRTLESNFYLTMSLTHLIVGGALKKDLQVVWEFPNWRLMSFIYSWLWIQSHPDHTNLPNFMILANFHDFG